MTKSSFTRTGSRRAGDDFQDIAALEVIVDWLDDPALYQAMYVEADDVGFLDDIKAVRTDGGLVLKQVKFATHPNSAEDEWTWERLLAANSARIRASITIESAV